MPKPMHKHQISPTPHCAFRLSVRVRAMFGAALGVVVGIVFGCGSPPSGPSQDISPEIEAGSMPSDPARDSDSARDLVLITVDTLRHDAVGFADEGPWRTPTPALEALATEGRVFTHAVAHAPLTLPSHASMLTGLYPYQHGIRENAGFVLPAEAHTLAESLAAEGFATAAFVSAFVLDGRFGLDQGFEVYGDRIARGGSFQVSERRGDETVAKALAWWQEQEGRRRFLWLHLFDPHAPYDAGEPWSALAATPYQGEVAAVDAFLSPLLDQFAADEPRPLVAFTSDHGEALGDHGELTHGIFAYQSTLRVPLVMWGPGVEPGRDDRLARHIDLMPTLLEQAGLEVPSELPGRSLLRAAPESEESYFEALSGALNRGWAPLRGMIRDGQKYIDLPLVELYDLGADPGETRNLADSRRREARILNQLLPQESQWPPDRSELSSEDEARLRSLGYLTGDGGSAVRFTAEDDPKRLIELDRDIHRFSELFAVGDPASLNAAVKLAQSMVERRPSMGVAHTQLVQGLLESGRHAEALAAMARARAAGVASVSLLRQLGLSLTEAGRPDEAVEVLRPLAESEDPEAMGALAAALSELGELDAASRWMGSALELAPEDGGLHENAAVLALRRQEAAAALVHGRKATELRPGSAPAWNHLGVALFLQARPLEALEAWQRSVSLDPNQFDTLYNLGIQAAELGRPDLARRALEDFEARAPRDRYAADLPKVRALLQRLNR